MPQSIQMAVMPTQISVCDSVYHQCSFFLHCLTFNNIVFKNCIHQPNSCVQVGRQCQVSYIQQSFFFVEVVLRQLSKISYILMFQHR